MKQVFLVEFVDRFAEEDLKNLHATISTPGEAVGKSENLAITTRAVKTEDGPRIVTYYGISMDRRN